MSTDQESPPAQNETTSKDSSSTVQNLTLNTAANEPETGSKPDSDPSIPQAENYTTSENPPSTDKGVNNPNEDDTGTSKQGSANEADPRFQETNPAENETSKDSDSTTQAAATSKQETDDAENLKKEASPQPQEIKPAENETSKDSDNTKQATATSKQETDDAENLKKEATPQAQEIKPAENETPKDSDNSMPAAATSKQETDDAENLEKEASPQAQEIKPAENETPKDSDNTMQAAATSKQETDEAENLKKEASPQAQEIKPAEDDNTSKISSPPDNDPAQASSTDKREAGGTETSSQVSDPSAQKISPAQDETAPQNSLPPEDDVSQSTEIKNQEPEDLEDDLSDAIEDDPGEQKITPFENEATAGHPSSPNNFPTQSTATTKPEKVPNQEFATKDADSRPPVHEIKPDENMNTVKSSSLPTDFNKDADSHPKKSPFWKKLRCFFKTRRKDEPETSTKDKEALANLIKADIKEAKEALANLIKADIDSVNLETEKLKEYTARLIKLKEDADQEYQKNKDNHGELRKSMIKLKLLIPSTSKIDSDSLKSLQSRLKARDSIPQYILEKMPQLHKNEKLFYCSSEFKEFEARYKKLELKLRLCLLCFSIFPGNDTIRKRLMVRWWVAEGLSSEEEASEHFRKLREEGFIVPVNDNRSLSIGRYRMHPLHQSMLKKLAEDAKFFNFDNNGEPTQNYTNTFQACLVGEGLLSYDDLKNKGVKVEDLEKIHLVMNVDEPILDFKPHWFSMMRNVNVLYLGRWQASDAAHIEVEETNFLDGLKNMNFINFLSLQGISNIIKLTESILALKKLEWLDLRACHNLEAIPAQIGVLKSLTHLDMSECYLLDHMPKSLSSLMHLRVFKGFVVNERNYKSERNYTDSCTLRDLVELKNLTKLCIYTTSKQFPDQENHVKYLQKLNELRKLTISWGGDALKAETKGGTSDHSEVGKDNFKLPSKLEKLDLKCFPLKATPSWLSLANLKHLEHLKKLYIRGGRFSDLGQYQDTDGSHTSPSGKDVWKVEVLRLKYLSNLEMEWRQLHELFPGLVYLEQVSCPKLTLFNCGARGVWINQKKVKDWEKGQVIAPNETDSARAECRPTTSLT